MYSPAKDGFPKAKEAAEKALEIDEGLAEAHSSLPLLNFVGTATGSKPKGVSAGYQAKAVIRTCTQW